MLNLRSLHSSFNNKGFSLVGVLITSTIGTIVVLGLASSQVMLSKSQKRISDKNKKDWLQIRMESVIRVTEDTTTCLVDLEEKLKDYDFSAPNFCLAKNSGVSADISTCGALVQADCNTNQLCHWYADSRAETHIRAFKDSNSQTFPSGSEVTEVKVTSAQCCFSGVGTCASSLTACTLGESKDYAFHFDEDVDDIVGCAVGVKYKECDS